MEQLSLFEYDDRCPSTLTVDGVTVRCRRVNHECNSGGHRYELVVDGWYVCISWGQPYPYAYFPDVHLPHDLGA